MRSTLPVRPTRSPGLALVACLALAASATALTQGAAGSGAKPQRPTPRQLEERVPMHLFRQDEQLLRYQLVQLQVPATPDEPFTLELPLGGERHALELRKHSVRSAAFEVLAHRADGSYEELDPGAIRTFRGRSREEKGVLVAGSILPTGLEARVTMPDRREFGIEPHYASFAAGDRTTYVVYDLADVLEEEAPCHSDEVAGTEVHPEPPGIVGGGCTGGEFCVAELALDCDFTMYQEFQSNTGLVQDMAELFLNLANILYERELGLSHRWTTVVIRTSAATEPAGYAASTTMCGILGAFRDHWEANHTGIARDSAYLLTQRFGGGCAWPGQICGGNQAYGASAVREDQSLRKTATILAHELGHNWNADHCTCPFWQMHPTPPIAFRFHPVESLPEMETFRDTRPCLNPGWRNDDCEDATEICTGVVFGSTAGATNDGSATCGSSDSSPDVWYRYTPASSGTVTVNTCGAGTNFDTVLSVYSECGGGTGFQIDCDDDTCGASSQLVLSVTAGNSYLIRVAGWSGASGDFELSLSGPFCAAPTYDSRLIPLQINPGEYVGTTAAAGTDGPPNCALNTSADVWFLYRVGNDGFGVGTPTPVMTLDTYGSGFDTVLTVYDWSAPDPLAAQVDCNDDAFLGTVQSLIELTVTEGDEYLIRVSGYDGAAGSYRLGLTGPDTASDLCSTAMPVGIGTHYGTFEGVRWPDGEVSCGPTGSVDLWYRFDAPVTGTLEITTCGTHDLGGVDAGTDTTLHLYAGCPATLANLIDCDDDASSSECPEDQGVRRDAWLSAGVTGGQSYYVRVARYAWYEGRKPFVFDVDFTPSNDDCANAIAVGTGTWGGTLVGASNDGTASCGTASTSPDVWYTFTVPFDCILTVSTCGTHDIPDVDEGVDTVLSLHESCSGTELACNDDSASGGLFCLGEQGDARDSIVQIDGTAGQTVWIRVANFGNGRVGDFFLHVGCSFISPPANDACADAITIGDGTTAGSLLGATNDGSATCGLSGSNPDVWYRYVCATGGTVEVTTCGTHDLPGEDRGVDTVLSIWSDCPEAGGNQLDCSDDHPTCLGADAGDLRDSALSVSVAPGAALLVRVSHYGDSIRGEFLLNVSCTAPGSALCFGDGSGTTCPCGNVSAPGAGCLHSGGVGMRIHGNGSPSVAADDLQLTATDCPPNNAGIFYVGEDNLWPGDVLFDGLQCAGGNVRRFRGLFQTGGVVSDTDFVAQDPSGTYFTPTVTYVFQYFSRDVASGSSPCGGNANLSPGYRVTMSP